MNNQIIKNHEQYSETVEDADLYKAVIKSIGLDRWCRSRRHVASLESAWRQLPSLGDDGALVSTEAKAVSNQWIVLETRLVGDKVPTNELGGHIDFVWSVLELAKAATSQHVDPELAFSAVEEVMGSLLPPHQKMVCFFVIFFSFW